MPRPSGMSRCCPQECPGSLEPFCGPELAAPRARCCLVCRRVHESKVDLALGMIERAVRDGIPSDIVLADAFYGNAHEFRETVRQRGVDDTPQPSELVGSVDFCRRISGSYFCTLSTARRWREILDRSDGFARAILRPPGASGDGRDAHRLSPDHGVRRRRRSWG
ncbi:transposase [Sorangium sp. So ce117]|uniref:transposase n=1 Tax=Sorangium sp. So ce117 TaxID=3133277 RepID=UPI003F620000